MAIGIIGAMDVEVELLEKQMRESSQVEAVKAGKLELLRGELAGKEVLVARCGVGMVNAAVAAAVLTNMLGVNAVINTGVAGSLDARIDIGDVVVADSAVNHIMDVCNLGYAPGQTPGTDGPAIKCSARLADAAQEAAAALGIRAHRGRVASGDRFVRTQDDKDRIRSIFEASCCEMEGAAIAQVCSQSGVPCVIIRAISDKADGTDHIDYDVFEAGAARDCAALTIEMLKRLS